jgi:hypothetical protein
MMREHGQASGEKANQRENRYESILHERLLAELDQPMVYQNYPNPATIL